MKFTWEMNPASSGDAGPYVEPFPRPDERDEPFPGAEASFLPSCLGLALGLG